MTRFTLASLFLFLLLACAAPPPPTPVNSIKPLDTGTVTAVKLNLKGDPVLAASDIKVTAENDLLVLRGSVPSEEAKKKAEEVALKTPRIKKVANHLEIKDY